MSRRDQDQPPPMGTDFDEFDFDDDILDENDLVELAQYVPTPTPQLQSRLPADAALATPTTIVLPQRQQQQQQQQQHREQYNPPVAQYNYDQQQRQPVQSPGFGHAGIQHARSNTVHAPPAQLWQPDPEPENHQQAGRNGAHADQTHRYPDQTYNYPSIDAIEDALLEDDLDLQDGTFITGNDTYARDGQSHSENVNQAGHKEGAYGSVYAGAGTVDYYHDQRTGAGTAATADTHAFQLELETMQKQIQSLRDELENTRAKATASETSAQTRLGEVLVLRGKLTDLNKQAGDRAAQLEQRLAESVARHQAEIDAIRGDREKIAVDNRFLEHEIAQVARRPKGKSVQEVPVPTATVSSEVTQSVEPVAPPTKRIKHPGFGDGFDDDGAEKQTVPDPTPKKAGRSPQGGHAGGVKRKRASVSITSRNDSSSGLALESKGSGHRAQQVQDEDAMLDIDERVSQSLAGIPPKPLRDGVQEAYASLLRRLVSHRTPGEDWNPFESLMSLYFPSSRESVESKSIGSTLLTSIEFSPLSLQSDSSLTGLVMRQILNLWEQALDEQYYDSVRPLVSLLHVVVGVGTAPLDLLAPLVKCSTLSIDPVAIPIGRQAQDSSVPPPLPAQELVKNVPVTLILSLLCTVAKLSSSSEEAVQNFWSAISYDFVLLMLMRVQPLEQILLMLDLLQSSITQTSFGSISTKEKQARDEGNLIDRLLLLLFEIPQPHSPTNRTYSPRNISTLRLSTIQAFSAICTTGRGIASVATHPTALPVLFRFLCSAILDLHGCRQTTRDLTLSVINVTTRVLYSVIVYGGIPPVEIRERNVSVGGAESDYLVSLTRLAFSDQLWIDVGIEAEVVDAAHHLLDEYLTPDEGKKLFEVFPSSNADG